MRFVKSSSCRPKLFFGRLAGFLMLIVVGLLVLVPSTNRADINHCYGADDNQRERSEYNHDDNEHNFKQYIRHDSGSGRWGGDRRVCAV